MVTNRSKHAEDDGEHAQVTVRVDRLSPYLGVLFSGIGCVVFGFCHGYSDPLEFGKAAPGLADHAHDSPARTPAGDLGSELADHE